MNAKQITANGLYPASSLAGHDDGCPPDEEHVDTCRHWLRLFAVPTKGISMARSSYGLKHTVERWTRTMGQRAYVSNGAFIEAARRDGYRFIPVRPGSPNAVFNMRVRRTPRQETP